MLPSLISRRALVRLVALAERIALAASRAIVPEPVPMQRRNLVAGALLAAGVLGFGAARAAAETIRVGVTAGPMRR